MSGLGLSFLAISLALVLLLRFTPLRTRRVETIGVTSVAFIATVSRPADAACLLAMAATGWVLTKALAHNKAGWLLGSGIAAVVAEFLASRHAVAELGPTIGLSYIMFRVIHVMVDAQGDELPPGIRLRDYLCFLACYLTFLAGPIQRIQDFTAETTHPVRTALRDALADNLPLILGGYVQFTVLAGACMTGFAWSQTSASPAIGHLVGWASFAGYLYTSFAGYTDIVRGIGGLVDFHLPENFDRPWAAANFLDLWSRWHISLSEWFKLYVFNPTVKALIGSANRSALTPWFGAAGYFLAFFLMGVWHGIGLRFVLYGLCLGAATSVNKLYQTWLLKRLGRKAMNALFRRKPYAAAARGLAVGFFVLALGFLWIPAGAGDLPGWIEAGAILMALAVALSAVLPVLGFDWRPPVAATAVINAAAVLAYLAMAGPVPPLLYAFF